MQHLVGIGFPTFSGLLGFPLLMGWIVPNALFGYRTMKTMASEEMWYEANQALGIGLLGASLVGFGIYALVSIGLIAISSERTIPFLLMADTACITLAILIVVTFVELTY